MSRKALQITGTELERKSRDQVWIRFTEEQIIAVLREHEAGAKAGDLARKHGISEATLYNWKAKHGDMDVSDAKRLRSLEDENRKLKKLLAESMLDQTALKELLTKNGNARRQARGCARRRPLFRNSQALGTSTLDFARFVVLVQSKSHAKCSSTRVQRYRITISLMTCGCSIGDIWDASAITRNSAPEIRSAIN